MFELPAGATPLSPEDEAGLLPNLATKADLNEFEAVNIVAGALWAVRSRRIKKDFPNVTALMLLHKRMFDKTWRWAGKFRRIDTNIGIDWHNIAAELHNLCENVRAQLEYGAYPIDEIAARFHHELVAVHPFPNGNGRHARLAADLLLTQYGRPPFSWGQASLVVAGDTRSAYIHALQQADAGLIGPLLAFVRS